MNAVSLARAHRQMRTSFFEIGGVINTDLRPAAVGPYCTPNFSEFGTHLPMRPRQTQRIPPICPRQTYGIPPIRGG